MQPEFTDDTISNKWLMWRGLRDVVNHASLGVRCDPEAGCRNTVLHSVGRTASKVQ